MYLFQRADEPKGNAKYLIYIPLCIYFNFLIHFMQKAVSFIYIPLCIYFNAVDTDYMTYKINLHSTMYLFQLCFMQFILTILNIYIPLCIYFNAGKCFDFVTSNEIYIPLCIYFNLILCKIETTKDIIYIPLCIYFNYTA